MISLLLALAVLSQTPAPKPADPEDPGPPVVKRGGNAPRKGPAKENGPNIITPLPKDEPETAVPAKPNDEAAPRVMRSRPDVDPLIEKAMEAAYEYDGTLPNFVCDEIVKRMTSSAKPPKWKKHDLVEAEILYVNQKEEQRNFRINGKPLKTGTPEETGSWSYGDWGTTLVDVLSPMTAANFKRRGKDKIAGIECDVFDYTVQKANSHWTVRFGTSIKPAYKGAIWVDPLTARTLRIEMQATKLPADYELDWVEQMTEYGWVTIGTDKYLLPTKSQNIACRRYTDHCSMNDIEFKNYRKFAVESTISTTESDIKFGDEAEKAQPVPAAPPVTDPKKKKKER
jgi:hypothetical protein